MLVYHTVIPDKVGNVAVTAVYRGLLHKTVFNNHKVRGIKRYFKNYASLGIDKELDCSYKPSTALNWCGDNLYGFALRRWCNVNI